MLVFYIIFRDKYIIFYGVNDIIFGLILIFDTQLMATGNKKDINKDDFIIGAMFIFFDIIMVFYYILDALANNN